jgi:hypothetical protein
MRFVPVRFALALLLSNAILSCASMKDVVKAKQEEKGVTQAYIVGAQQAFDISRKILRENGVDAIENHEQEGYMLGVAEMNDKSYATFTGVWVEKGDKDTVNITVVTKRKAPFQLANRLTEDGFHRIFAKELAAVSSPNAVSKDVPKETNAEADSQSGEAGKTSPAELKKTSPSKAKTTKKSKKIEETEKTGKEKQK